VQTDEKTSGRSNLIRLACAIVWVVFFQIEFFSQTMPNTGFGRWRIVREISATWLTTLSPFEYPGSGEMKSGWQFFAPRLPFVGTACVLLTSAWLLGRAVCCFLIRRLQLLTSERLVITMGVGLSLQTLWILGCGVFGQLSSIAILTPTILASVFCAFSWLRHTEPHDLAVVAQLPDESPYGRKLRWLVVLAFTPFVLHLFLGGFTPPFDFDVREYHLQGPKEWYQAGRITTLQHNAYTSFPFLSEMLSLGGMVLEKDWWRGAMTGKLTLTAFQLLSTLAVYAICRRWIGRTVGVIAALALISTPWMTRISIIAYAEGAITFYLIASTMAALIAARVREPKQRLRMFAVTGFLSGSAMAAKYPGVLSVVLPVGLFLLVVMVRNGRSKDTAEDAPQTSIGKHVLIHAIVYIGAVTFAVGPWLLRNAVDTGNPVYPLAWRVFGANDWSPEMDAKWKRAHSASEHDLQRIPAHLRDVAVRNDWQSGFLFAFALAAMLLIRRYPTVTWLWGYAAWILFTWWLFTHRIDRFWVPLLPIIAVVAASAWKISDHKVWKRFMVTILVLNCVFNYGLCRFPGVVGFHGGLFDLDRLRVARVRDDFKVLNTTLPKNARVLMVGEAEVFDAEFDLVYNTVFDDNIFEQWTSVTGESDKPAMERPMKSPAEIRAILREHGITHVYVNWSEILRYRLTYGFTDFVYPQRFTALQEQGVLKAPLQTWAGDWSNLSKQQKSEVESWRGGDTLHSEGLAWTNIQLFPVIRDHR